MNPGAAPRNSGCCLHCRTYTVRQRRHGDELSVATEATQLVKLLSDPSLVRSAQSAMALALGNLSRQDEALEIIEALLRGGS
jgi:hypothetical protein